MLISPFFATPHHRLLQCTSAPPLAVGRLFRPAVRRVHALVCQLSIGELAGRKGGTANSKYDANVFTKGSYRERNSESAASTAGPWRSSSPASRNECRRR